MPLVVPDVGEVTLLEMLRLGVHWLAASVYLFKNNLAPDKNTVIGDIVEADFSGYAELVTNFGAATIVAHKGTAVGTAPLDFIHNGGGTANTVYGYYVKFTGLTDLIYLQTFPAPITMANNGDKISILLKFTGNSEYDP